MRNEYADRFCDCVVNRSSKDYFIRFHIVLIFLVVVGIITIVMIEPICDYYSNYRMWFIPDSMDIAVMFIVCFLCSLFSFTLMSMGRRAVIHERRDAEWRESLIGYIRSYGGDVTRLEAMGSETGEKGLNVSFAVSFLFWVLICVSIIVLALFQINAGSEMVELSNTAVISIYVFVMLQFLLTIGSIVWYPYGHRRHQVAFTEELSVAFSEHCDIDIRPMTVSSKTHSRLFHVILFIATLGIYSIFLVGLSCAVMNRHIEEQWMFEDELLEKIIEREGAVGVGPTRGNDTHRPVKGILRIRFCSRHCREDMWVCSRLSRHQGTFQAVHHP